MEKPASSNQTVDGFKQKIVDFFSVRDCIKTLAVNSFAISAYFVASSIMSAVNLHYVGIEGDEHSTAAIGLGNTLVVGTNTAMIWGLNIGTLALCSQSFGAKELRLSGYYFQRALSMRFLLFVPSYLMLYFSEGLFLAMGVDPLVASKASQYCRLQFVPLVCLITMDTLKSLLLSAGIFTPFLVIQIFMTVTHAILCLFFSAITNLGIAGVCYCQIVTNACGLALIILYVKWKRPCQESLFWPDNLNLADIFQQFKQELPIGVLFYLEMMGFELNVGIAGQFPAVELGGQVIVFNIIMISFMPLFGMCMTLTSIVGNAMGEGDGKKAIRFRNAGILYAMTFFLIQVIIMVSCRSSIIGLYTTHPETAAKAEFLLMCYCSIMVLDFLQVSTTAVLRGIGLEHFACKLYLISFYGFGLPTGYVFGSILEWYSAGLWVGIGTAVSIVCIVSGSKLYTVDLQKQADGIVERIKSDKSNIEKEKHYIEMEDIKS